MQPLHRLDLACIHFLATIASSIHAFSTVTLQPEICDGMFLCADIPKWANQCLSLFDAAPGVTLRQAAHHWVHICLLPNAIMFHETSMMPKYRLCSKVLPIYDLMKNMRISYACFMLSFSLKIRLAMR